MTKGSFTPFYICLIMCVSNEYIIRELKEQTQDRYIILSMRAMQYSCQQHKSASASTLYTSPPISYIGKSTWMLVKDIYTWAYVSIAMSVKQIQITSLPDIAMVVLVNSPDLSHITYCAAGMCSDTTARSAV